MTFCRMKRDAEHEPQAVAFRPDGNSPSLGHFTLESLLFYTKLYAISRYVIIILSLFSPVKFFPKTFFPSCFFLFLWYNESNNSQSRKEFAMIYKALVLDERYPDATLTPYLHSHTRKIDPIRPAMIVCPGGGYHNLASHEEEPIALYYLNAGMNTFVLRYSINEGAANYAPLIQAALSVKHVREHAEEYGIDPEKIFICGFSAGGHLAASCGILWNSRTVRDALGITDGISPEGINRPNGLVLSYPVISGMEYRHANSFRYLTGKQEPTDEERKPFSLEYHVDGTTPPVFVWHTFDDRVVSIRNTLLLLDALTEHGIPFEAHIYPHGSHGLAFANAQTTGESGIDPHVESWAKLSVEWTNLL